MVEMLPTDCKLGKIRKLKLPLHVRSNPDKLNRDSNPSSFMRVTREEPN